MRNKAKSLCRQRYTTQCKTLFNSVHCILYSARCTCILNAKGDFFLPLNPLLFGGLLQEQSHQCRRESESPASLSTSSHAFTFFSFSIFCLFLAQGNFPCPIYFHSSITGSPNTFSHSRPHTISLASTS